MWYWRLNLVWWFARLVCLNFWFCVDDAVWEAWERWPQCERWPLAGGSLQGFIALSNFLLSLSASCRQTRIWPASFLLLPPCLPIALPSSLYGLALWNHKSKKLSSLHCYRLWCSIAGVEQWLIHPRSHAHCRGLYPQTRPTVLVFLNFILS